MNTLNQHIDNNESVMSHDTQHVHKNAYFYGISLA